jgi:hypothetical protein
VTDADRDLVVEGVVRRIPVPDHAPDFWHDLERRLHAVGGGVHSADVAPEAEDLPVVALQPPSPPHRLRRRRLRAAAAVLVVIGAVGALAVTASRDEGRLTPAATPPSEPPPTTSPSEITSAPGSDQAVLAFLDALGDGDLEGAAARLGPASEAYLEATAGSVESFLRVAEEGYGPWAASPDRRTSIVEIRTGEVVVVVTGTVEVEGTTERRADAFAARYAESARAWFVESWAHDPDADAFTLRVTDARDRVEIFTPAEGSAWLAVDDTAPIRIDIDADHTGTWDLSLPVDGQHLVVVAFINDTTFTAMASRTPCRPPDAPPSGWCPSGRRADGGP